MPLTTPSSPDVSSLGSFVESVCGDTHLRVEQDFGGGYVRLRSTEAEKRQAAQDIRGTEDIVIELLRNARDAGAQRIFIALNREEEVRSLVVVDDGCGIPESMHERVFEPRVTSKLETAHMDKWGMHGRGMALYSVSANAEVARVMCSAEGIGCALLVKTNLTRLGEKTDQSTFPHFELRDGVHAMRGPRNILRTAAEFALEHRKDCAVFCGSVTEIAASLYAFGLSTTTLSSRAFASDTLPVTKRLACAADPESFASIASDLGLELSQRSARRIMDGEIKPVCSLLDRLTAESFPEQKPARKRPCASKHLDARGFKLASEDASRLGHMASVAFKDIAARYYLNANVTPLVRASRDAITITIPVEKLL